MRAQFTTYTVPGWGVGELWTGEGVVLAHEFRFGAVADEPCGEIDTLSARVSVDKNRCLTPVLTKRLAGFFAGEADDFRDVPIDLDWATPFQRAVADALRAVPRGAVVSYGELAALAGRPGAARAAGSFCAHNRFMLIVPCHRVVGATGLGGYGSAGTETKRRLLALEGVVV